MKLRYYQKEAIQKAVDELSVADRATIVMCCGSGKTAVGVGVAKQLKVNYVAVVAPTILLAEQLKNVWSKEQSKKVVIFNSAQDVDYDNLRDEINANKSIVIVTTYHSANTCVDAFQQVGIKLDLVIYDEAHRTSGKFESLFNRIIKRDDAISKHLFMTATPKMASYETDETEFFSMDSEEQYGKICYTYTLRQAINDKVVSDYRILVSHVDQNDLRKSIFSNEEKHYYAIAYSLKKAIKKFSLNKVITYHSSIEKAQKLTEIFTNVISDYKVFHISSSQPSKIRDENLFNYANSEKAIITNVRCFSEGIDVPDTDAVMFCDEKTSQIDITQNMGRAIRLSESKSLGYIIVPAFVDENSVGLGDYSGVLNIVHALSESDEELADVIKLRVSQNEDEKEKFIKNIKKFVFTYDDLGLSANELENRIYIKIMDSPKSFFERLEQIKEFVKKNGHARIGQDNCDDKSLLGWIKYNRKAYKNKLLSQIKIDMLNKVGFVWDAKENLFYQKLEKMRRFLVENEGNIPMDGASIKYPRDLLYWVGSLREKYAKGELAEERVKALKELDFDFEPVKTRQARQEQIVKDIFAHLASNKQMDKDLRAEFVKLRLKIKSNLLRRDLVEKIQDYEKKYNVSFFIKIDNRYPDHIKEKAIELCKTGLSYSEIAKKVGATTGIISKWAIDAGFPKKKIITEEMEDFIASQALGGATSSAIGSKMGLSSSCVLNIIKKNGLVYDKKTKKYSKK